MSSSHLVAPLLATTLLAALITVPLLRRRHRRLPARREQRARARQGLSRATLWVGGQTLELATSFGEAELEPLFSGAAWAGSVIWPAALRLCDYLAERVEGDDVCGSFVMELGAGLGTAGFGAAMLNAKKVLLTEQEPLQGLLLRNIRDNPALANCSSCLLDWAAFRSPQEIPELYEAQQLQLPDFILVSDCIYEYLYGDSWKHLLRVISLLCKPNHTVVFNSVERREADDGVDSFIQSAKLAGFRVELIRDEILDENKEHLQLYRMMLVTASASTT